MTLTPDAITILGGLLWLLILLIKQHRHQRNKP